MNLVLKNLTSLSLSRVISLVSAFFLSIVMARKLGPEAYGVYALVFVMIGYFSSFIDMGVSEITVREIASQRYVPQALYKSVLSLRWFLYLVSLFIFLVYELATSDQKFVTLLLGMFILLGEAMYSGVDAIFRGVQKIYWLSVCEIVYSVTRFVLGTLILILGFGLNALLVVIISATLIKLILINWIYLQNFKPVGNERGVFQTIKFLLGEAKTIALWRLTSTIYIQMNIPLIVFYLGESAAGNYKAAMNLIEIPSTFLTVMSSVLFPFFAELKQKAIDRYFRTIEGMLSWGGILFFISFFFVQAFGSDLLILLFGRKYALASELLTTLFFLVYFNFIVAILSLYLLIEKLQLIAAILTVVNIVVKASLFFVYYKIMGEDTLITAARLVVSVELINIIGILFFLFYKNTLKWDMIKTSALITSIGLAVMILKAVLVKDCWLSFLLSTITFISMLFLFRIIYWSESKLRIQLRT